MEHTSKSLIRAFSGYGAGVVVSRLSGLAREVSLAFFFGTSPELALFMVAYRFANLLRRMLAESPLTSSFIPLFEAHKQKSPEEGAFFMRDLFYSFALLVLGIVLLIIVSLVFTRHFLTSSDSIQLCKLTECMTPSLLFLCLYGLCAAFLQSEKQFFLASAAPVMFNFVWIGAAYYAYISKSSHTMFILAWGIVIAFAMQWAVLLPKVLKQLRAHLSIKNLFKPKLFAPSLKKMVKPFCFGMLGIGATQINIALDGVFARFASPEGPAFLWYAVRLEQLPIALFGVAISAVILPILTRAVHSGDDLTSKKLLEKGQRQTFALMSLSMFGIFSLGRLIVEVLFGHGAFDAHSIEEVTNCLWGYSIGLIPHGILLLFSSCFYAYKDYKTPMHAALISVVINVCLNVVMVFFLKWGALSIAIGTSLTSLFNALYLIIIFERKRPSIFSNMSMFYLKHLVCGVSAFLIVGFLSNILAPLLSKPALLAFLGSSCIASYLFMEKALKSEEVLELVRMKWRKG